MPLREQLEVDARLGRGRAAADRSAAVLGFVAGRVREQALHLRPRRAGAFADDATGRAVDQREVRRARHVVLLPRRARHHDREIARREVAQRVQALLGRVLGDDDEAHVGGQPERRRIGRTRPRTRGT